MGLLVAAIYLTHIKVTAIQIGAHTSRLVGVLCAIVAFYYFRHGLALHIPVAPWTKTKLMEVAKAWLPPGLLVGVAAYYAITIFRNWRSEFISLVTSTGWLLIVAALALAGRYVLIQ